MFYNDPQIKKAILEMIERALVEDIGPGDVTTEAIGAAGREAKATVIAKSDCVVAGLWVFAKTFQLLKRDVDVRFLCDEGAAVKKGDVIAHVSGPASTLLSAERTALNFLQRMSGIASQTRLFVEAVKGTKTRILDTRKTAPGLRLTDKWAVVLGGGNNHRMGLYDMAMIKENHIAAAGGIKEAVKRVRDHARDKIGLVVEITMAGQLEQLKNLKVNRILLDNMSLEEMREAVALNNGRFELEASGNVSLENAKEIAQTGVDFISVGSLTHSVKAADISMIFDQE